MPLFFTPQANLSPALTDTKVPAGGVAWPESLLPQQAMVPAVFTPQANRVPVLTDAKVPAGGEDSPCPLKPQQAAAPAVLTPHAKTVFGLTDAKVPRVAKSRQRSCRPSRRRCRRFSPRTQRGYPH